MSASTVPPSVEGGAAPTSTGTSNPTSTEAVGDLTVDTCADIPFADCHITAGARYAAARVLTSGWVTTGVQTEEFEEEFAAYLGADHAVAVSSCTAALELSLRAMHLEPGDRVLTSTITFCGAVQAILHAGLQPVLVDVDPVTGMPNEQTTRRAARSCGGAAAMVVVHWAGDPVDVSGLAAAAGLPVDRVLQDAAHALGTEVRGVPVGAGGTACFSFYATKNLPIGEGGMVTTDDPERADWIRRARLHGMSADAWRRYLPGGGWRYDVQEAGLKANLTDLQAAIGRAQLTRLERWQQRRAQIAARYDAALAAVPGLMRPHRPVEGAGRHAWHLYPVQVLPSAARGRDDVIAGLNEHRIGTSVHFIPVHRLSYFAAAATLPSGGLPGADLFFDRVLSLPMYPRLRDDQVDRICEVLGDLVSMPKAVPMQHTVEATR
jgi:dTDP-4-amino-4,6-dideoxygalactose transaminase